MASIPNRSNWNFDIYNKSDFTLESLQRFYINKTLIKTQRMFAYKQLPDTIPADDLELILQTYGSATIAKVNDKLYAFRSGLGGKPNVYYRPTLSVVVNPALNYSANLIIDKDCVVMRNDPLYCGLMPIIEYNAYLLAEVDISFKFASINSRIPALIAAPDDNSKESAELFLQEIENGNKLGVIADEDFENNIKVYDYANANTSIVHLIELKQYIIGTFYQELGVQSPFNMKREAINEAEAALSQDILYPLIDTMLYEREQAINKVNKMFGTNISVELSSIWKQLRETKDLSLELQKSEIEHNYATIEDNINDKGTNS